LNWCNSDRCSLLLTAECNQAVTKGAIARETYQRRRAVVVDMQRLARGHAARRFVWVRLAAATLITALARGAVTRRNFLAARARVVKCQATVRCHLAKIAFHHLRAAAVKAQVRSLVHRCALCYASDPRVFLASSLSWYHSPSPPPACTPTPTSCKPDGRHQPQPPGTPPLTWHNSLKSSLPPISPT
jgi:hypothetical protein